VTTKAPYRLEGSALQGRGSEVLLVTMEVRGEVESMRISNTNRIQQKAIHNCIIECGGAMVMKMDFVEIAAPF
jgi:hypothetical protein